MYNFLFKNMIIEIFLTKNNLLDLKLSFDNHQKVTKNKKKFLFNNGLIY